MLTSADSRDESCSAQACWLKGNGLSVNLCMTAQPDVLHVRVVVGLKHEFSSQMCYLLQWLSIIAFLPEDQTCMQEDSSVSTS